MYIFFTLQDYWGDSRKNGSGDGTARTWRSVCCIVAAKIRRSYETTSLQVAVGIYGVFCNL